MSLSTEELLAVCKKLVECPESIKTLPDEQVSQIKKHLNPFGNVVAGEKSYINISLINWKDEYLKKFYMTSLVGYTYRLAEEYECDEELAAANKKLTEALKNATEEEAVALNRDHAAYVGALQKAARALIKRFLNRHFDFNPDQHLRTAHVNKNATSAGIVASTRNAAPKAQEASSNASPGSALDAKLQSKDPAVVYDYMRGNILSAYQLVSQSSKELFSVVNVLADPAQSREDAQGILCKKYMALEGLRADMQKIAEPLSAADCIAAWKVSPPADVFHHFTRYVTNHYEELRAVCAAYYNETPDFEYSIVYYDHFKSLEEAREYKIQHESEFKSEVLTVENSGITLIGPFKENRERIDYYNKHTEILKRMDEQREQDHKLGQDLVNKRVKDQKKKSIAEMGPDDKGLAAYSKVSNTVLELGARKGLTQKEQEEYQAALREKELAEVPDDAIAVDVFIPDNDGKLNRSIFYTQAEAPLHLQANSEFAEKYQESREETVSLDKSLVTKKSLPPPKRKNTTRTKK